jgi:hypothetical protein
MEDRMKRIARVLTLCGTFGAACGSDATARPQLPYASNETALIGGADNADELLVRTYKTPDGNDCIPLDDNVCAMPQSDCGDNGAADVLVNEHGAVVDVICYPTDGVSVDTFDGEVKDVGNNVVLVIDDIDDGIDVEGDVTIDGNNVTLYGHGPETSVIGGDLHLDKNNALVRGVRVEGNVTIDKNNPSIVDCVIQGDMLIRGNNVSLALCEVWGKLTIEGNNAILVGNRFAVPPAITGQNTICNRNVAFDGMIGTDELGTVVTCESK